MTTPTSRTIRGIGCLLFGALVVTSLPAQTDPEQVKHDAEEAERIRRLDQSERTRIATAEQQRFAHDEWIEGSAETLKDLVFLPPLPPALAATPSDLPVLVYPVGLADFAGESFFMGYGGLYYRRLLGPRQLERIAKYRVTRDRLTAALRARISEASLLPPGQLAAALAEFAPIQATALRQLEAEAESFRAEFALIDNGAALIKHRDTLSPGESAGLKAYFSLILAAQFHDGLSLEQRQLLHEIVLESPLGANAPSNPPRSFFLPAAARVRLPGALDDNLAGRLQRLQVLRQELKTELREAVAIPEGQLTDAKRRKAYADLATKQTPRFDEMERLAEEIRTGLAQAPYPDQPAPSGLPPELIRQVGTTVARRNEFQAEARRRLQEFSRAFDPERLKLAFRDQQPALELLPTTAPSEKPADERAALVARLQECNEQLQRDYRSLAADLETARLAVQNYHETLEGDNVPKVGTLTARLAQTYVREETWRRFADYHTAVLVPGLSPAQRRLLFNAALRDLEKHRLATLE